MQVKDNTHVDFPIIQNLAPSPQLKPISRSPEHKIYYQ